MVLFLGVPLTPRIAIAEAATTSTDAPAFDLETYTRAMERGVEAFRQGKLAEAAQAFQEAYLIHPSDPTLISWLGLVRDEQARREAMTHSMDAVKRRQAQPEAAREPSEPLWKRLTLSHHIPPGLEQTLTPVDESRPEVLTETKRAGFQRFYKEGIGFQPIRGLGFSGRTEIYAEPDPIESLELDAKVLKFSEISQYRRSILPLFTRSAAGRIVADYEPLPRVTYEYDARTTLHQYQTKYAFKDIDLQTHAVNALYSFPKIPLLGIFTINPWYKRVLQSSDHDLGSYEHRDELVANFSLQQTDNIEYFFQFDGYNSDKTRVLGSTKLKLFKGQVRLKVPPLRLFLIPSYEYSVSDFATAGDQFIKRDMFVDWGFDITSRLRAGSKEEIISTSLSQATSIPSRPDTEVFYTRNTLSYELFRDFDVSMGLDYGKGFGFSNFNNVGLRAEVEYFKPGILRTKFGYEWVSYYNIQDDLSLLYWKFFLFQ